jgi:hypothetical protein
MFFRRTLVLAVPMMLSCSGEDAAKGTPPLAADGGVHNGIDGTAPAPPPPIPPIRGTAQMIVMTDSGDVVVATDFSKTPPSALLPTADGYTTVTATGDAAGNFSVDGVPEGVTYFLRIDKSFYQTKARTVTLRQPVPGRGDATLAPANTSVKYTIAGLAPSIADGWIFSLWSSNLGLWIGDLCPLSSLPGNATQVSFTVDHSKTDPNWLIESAKGDTAIVFYGAPLGSTFCTTMRGAYTIPSFPMQPGQTTSVNGTLTSIPQNLTENVTWNLPFYEAHRTSVSRVAKGVSQGFKLSVVAGGDRFGPTGGGANLVTCSPSTWLTTPQSLALNYGNPIPPKFTPGFFARAYYEVPFSGPGGLKDYPTITHWHPPGTTKLDPPISPPRNLRIGNAPSAGDGGTDAGVGLAPVLAWDPPAVGTPARYVVTLYHLDRTTKPATSDIPATFYVTTESVRLPQGLLLAGQEYFVYVTAASYGGYSADDAMAKGFNVTGGNADALSDIFIP